MGINNSRPRHESAQERQQRERREAEDRKRAIAFANALRETQQRIQNEIVRHNITDSSGAGLGKVTRSSFTNTTNTEHFTEQNTTSNITFYFILILIFMLILYAIRKNRLNNNK